MTGMTSFCSF